MFLKTFFLDYLNIPFNVTLECSLIVTILTFKKNFKECTTEKLFYTESIFMVLILTFLCVCKCECVSVCVTETHSQ